MTRHPLDTVSLIAGAFFVIVAAAHLVRAATGESVDLGLLVPVALVGIGIAGLASALRTSGTEPETVTDEPGPPTEL